jgi:hypothetical protein
VTTRFPQLLLLALAALLAACSATNLLYSNVAFAYSNATPMLAWAVDDYVDLSDGQKDWVRERLARVMSWHRSRELPQYQRFLEKIETELEGGFSEEEVRSAHREMRMHYNRLLDQVIPHVADFLLQVDGDQVEQLERKFAEDNRKLVKEEGGSLEERRARGAKKVIEHLEAWTGRLEPAQRELVATRLRALPDISADRMADRRYRQSETLVLLRARPDRDAMIAGLRRLLVDTETWRQPEYLQKLKERDTRSFEMISALSATLSPDQRAHVQRRLRGYVRDITELTASARTGAASGS